MEGYFPYVRGSLVELEDAYILGKVFPIRAWKFGWRQMYFSVFLSISHTCVEVWVIIPIIIPTAMYFPYVRGSLDTAIHSFIVIRVFPIRAWKFGVD